MQVDLDSIVTKKAFGRIVGLSSTSVTRLFDTEVLKDGDTCGRWICAYAAHLREVAAGRRSSNGKLDLVAERAALTLEQRRIAEIKRLELEKAFVPIEDVMRQWEAEASAVRETFLALPGRVAPAMAGLTVPQMVVHLDREVRQALTALADR